MIGIMGAITEEVGAIFSEMESGGTVTVRGMRDYHVGVVWGVPVVAVYSRVGKVAAATTATHLIAEFKIDSLVFTGVAGGLDHSLNVGDVVVAGDLYQHDMDARPLYDRHEIPLLGKTSFSTTPTLRERSVRAAKLFLNEDLPTCISNATLKEFGISAPKAVEAAIASGDKFLANPDESAELATRLPVACVEMEGAAVAQVCHEYGIDYTVIRTISDSANATAHIDFVAFIREIAAVYSHGIVKRLLEGE